MAQYEPKKLKSVNNMLADFFPWIIENLNYSFQAQDDFFLANSDKDEGLIITTPP